MAGSILLVDDEATIRDSLSTILRKEGYMVHCAGHAREALDRLEHLNYDLVITDIRMPGMNGLELAEQIAGREPPPKILVITGFGSLDTAVQAQHRGVSDYLIKPINIKSLLQSVRSALEERQEETQSQLRPLDAKLKDRMEYFSLLSAFTAELNASLDVGEIMETTLDRLHKTLETTCASISLAAPVIGELYLFKNIKQRPAMVAGSGLCASLKEAAPLTSAPLLLSRRDNTAGRSDLHKPLYDAMDRENVQQAYFIPITVKKRVVGLVDVCTVKQKTFTETDLILSQVIVNQAASALARAFTYLEREERTKEIGLLYSLSVKLNQSLKISDSIKAICEGAVEITGADGSLLQTSLEPGAIKNFIYHRELGFHKEMRRGSQDWLIPQQSRSQAFYSNDPVMDERVNSLALYSLNIKSLAYVPLVYEWEGLGGLAVFYRVEEKTFDQGDLDLLHLYGRHASEVLLNSQLFEAIRSSRERLVIENNKVDRLKDAVSGALEQGIRIPLEQMIERVHLMENDMEMPRNHRETLALLLRSAGDMQTLLTCLLAICTGRSASRAATREEFDMSDMATTVLQELENEAKEKRISLKRVGSGGALSVAADAELIRSVLKTLLTGAIRATNDGGTVCISADRCESATEHEVKYEIYLDNSAALRNCGSMNETGVSYGAAGHHNVFSLEPVGDAVVSRGGRIWAERNEGGRTKFTFTLPGKIISAESPKSHAA